MNNYLNQELLYITTKRGKIMKKILPILFIGVLVLSGLGAVAHDCDVKEFDSETKNVKVNLIDGPRDYTHTVLVEVGTATWCGGCPASNAAWHDIYGSGNYDFEYTELVYDMNSGANSRFMQFNPKYVPTSYWDGGEFVYVGTNYGTFYNYLDSAGARVVPDLVADLEVDWLGDAEMEISYTVENNEGSNYPGRMRIYIIELESTLWDDASGTPYYHAFLDFAVNQEIDIPAVDSISDTITWDGVAEGYPGITIDNVQVILSVFDDEGYTSYSDPPSGNPFTAYYADETVAAIPEAGENNPPEIPSIDGSTEGTAGEEYTYEVCSTDPEGDEIIYCIDFGDDNGEVCVGPFPSETSVSVNHTWAEEGTYIVKVKATDTYGAESDWASLEVVMPVNQQVINPLLQMILERLPNAFPILRQLLGL